MSPSARDKTYMNAQPGLLRGVTGNMACADFFGAFPKLRSWLINNKAQIKKSHFNKLEIDIDQPLPTEMLPCRLPSYNLNRPTAFSTLEYRPQFPHSPLPSPPNCGRGSPKATPPCLMVGRNKAVPSEDLTNHTTTGLPMPHQSLDSPNNLQSS